MTLCGNIIAWDQFSWEAFATLAAGMLAVCAAYSVGLRQTAIQNRQANIQELDLRSRLFDKRYGIYEQTRDFISIIHPGGNSTSQDQEDSFRRVINEARFFL